MTNTNQQYSSTSTELPILNLDMIRSPLESLARTTVEKTLQQARNTSTDPVLGSSSTLATFYMMMPRNDGKALEQVLEIVARQVEGLIAIRTGLKFGIDPMYLGLVQSNDPAVLAKLQTESGVAKLVHGGGPLVSLRPV